MPKDLYKWEDGGGLKHHCHGCQQPLSDPDAPTRCVGAHVHPCKRYHCELFPKGQSESCKYCIGIDEERYKRHREVAKLILQLKHARDTEQTQTESLPLTPRVPNATPNNRSTPVGDSPMRKKERKAAKKAAKVTSKRQNTVTTSDIERVARVLHPDDAEDNDDAETERKFFKDPDIKLNRPFHSGTSNRRDVRNEFVKNDKRYANKHNLQIAPTKLDGLLQLLDVSPLTSNSSDAEKEIYAKLKASIESTLLHAQKEADMTMMRKAGFWRWASKKAYDRLAASGRITGRKGDSTSSTASVASSSLADVAAGEDETEESTEPDTGVTSEEEASTVVVIKNSTSYAEAASDVFETLKIGTKNPKEVGDGGWTTVGKPSKVKKPVGNITLVHNGGLAKMDSPVTPLHRRRGGLTTL